jgi:DNA-binding XRE family transcriptional regulator
VAVILKTSPDMITCWELNRNQPTAKFAKAIIDFLEYFPFKVEDCSLGKQLYYARLITGKTQEEVAKIIGCDESNLRYLELEKRKPGTETRRKIEEYLRMALTPIIQGAPFSLIALPCAFQQ